MGTEVHCKILVPGYYSMKDINEHSNSSSWSLFYGDKSLSNGQYYNGFTPRAITDGYSGYEKDALKQKMLEHEAIFRNQVHELHRLYRVQKDMMEEVKRKEFHKRQISVEASSSSSFLPLQKPSDEARNWNMPGFTLANHGRPSVVGSEVMDSPLSCTNGNGSQPGRSSKDHWLSESRPSKVRKKLFDLQLPADAYIDPEDGEQIQDTKISDVSSYHPNGNRMHAPENSVKLLVSGVKTEYHRDSSFDSRLKSSHGLADLNEPIQAEEAARPIDVSFHTRPTSRGEIMSRDFSGKPNSQFVDLSQELSQNSHHGSSNGNLNNHSTVRNGNRRGWLSYMYEAGSSGKDLDRSSKFLHPEQLPISSRPAEFMLDKAHQPSGIFPTDFRKEELWTGRNHSHEISDRSRDHSNYNHREMVDCKLSNPNLFVNSSDASNSWPHHSVTSWGKPNTSLTQKLTSSVHARPTFMSADTCNGSPLPSTLTNELSGNKWHANGSSRLNPGTEGDLFSRNGFYHGSSSGSNKQQVHLSSVGYDNLNCSKNDFLESEQLSNQGSRNFFKCSDMIDLNSDVNLNVIPKDSFNEAAHFHVLETLDKKRKCEDHVSGLPWVADKSVGKNAVSITRKDLDVTESGFLQASGNQLLKKGSFKDPTLLFNHNLSSASSGSDVGTKRESGDCPSKGKILGVPIFGKFCAYKNDSSSLVSTSKSIHFPAKDEDQNTEGKHKGIDINVAFDLSDTDTDKQTDAEAMIDDKERDTKLSTCRNFDLNACISEDEDALESSFVSTSVQAKVALEIDLEIPVVLETEEAILPVEERDQNEVSVQSPHPKDENDEIIRTAAEAIVAISSNVHDHHIECDRLDPPPEASLTDSLLWLSEVISSSAEDLDSKNCELPKCNNRRDNEMVEELDYFEAMTLQLKETREEDYMPKPFVPEFKEEEIGATSLPSRTRKGQARRGRQRRDFQRDILPGLVTLSRHEVTEDIQTFGSLMRATGHQWNGGLTRRNGTRGGARGRRRCVVEAAPAVEVTPVCTPLAGQLNNSEAGVEDRSLTGWGRTTRRPRRQRCPAGNNLAVALT